MQTLMSLFANQLRRLKRNEQGAISVEMALIGTAVFFVALPLSDLIVRTYNGQQLASSVRAAMQYAINNPDDPSGIEDIAAQNAGSLDSEKLSFTTTQFCECNATVQACGDVCAYGEQTFLTISGAYTQTLRMSYPVYGNEVPITHDLTLRTQ